jgi:hypothetical protein
MISIRRLAVAAVAGSLVACSGAPQQGLSPTNGASSALGGSPAQLAARGVPQTLLQPAVAHRDTRRSWMSPEAKKMSNLLYVAGEDSGDVFVYSYPQGKPEGTLTGFNDPSALCTDKAGDVFITNGGGTTVDVYAHGGSTPLRSLSLPGYPELSCSVDPKTGNFAIGALVTGEVGAIVVFAKAQGKAIEYVPSGQYGVPGCAYDNHSNLFCNAYSSDDHDFLLYELPKKSTNVSTVSVSGVSGLRAGPMQWDGKHLTFGSAASGTLYQIGLSGSSGSIVGSTVLTGTGWVWQFWIKGKRVIVPTYAGSDPAEAGYFPYPAGGSATKAITGFDDQPDGATISSLKS